MSLTRDEKLRINAHNKMMAEANGKVAPEQYQYKVRAARRPHDPADGLTEHQEQQQVISWWNQSCALYKLPPIALLAIPNSQVLMGSAKHPERVMQYLKSEGFRVGAPDLLLAVSHRAFLYDDADASITPIPGAAGLFIEMKRAKGGVQSPEQINFEQYLNSAGYKYILCRGADSAINAIKQYLA